MILSRDKIRELMLRTEGKMLCDRGWATVGFNQVHSEEGAVGPYPRAITSKYIIEFGTMVTLPANNYAQVCEESTKAAAYSLHHEMYGDIVERLGLLKSRMDYGHQSECKNLLDELLAELTQ